MSEATEYRLHLTGDDEADHLLSVDPLALLLGMLLDQQMPMERAFLGPAKLAERLGHPDRLDAAEIASMDPEHFAAICAQPPAVHRFHGSMAKRAQELCRHLVEHYDGDAAAVWERAATGQQLFANLTGLPGFAAQKAQVFTALLAKRLGVQPPGWREVTGPYGEEGVFRSVADVDGPESIAKVRAFKKEAKAAARGS